MRLITNDKLGLMQITQIATDSKDNIVATGIIMGSIPIRAVLTPEEMKKGLSMMSLKTILAAVWIALVR